MILPGMPFGKGYHRLLHFPSGVQSTAEPSTPKSISQIEQSFAYVASSTNYPYP
jgi:hypothetical protein